MEFPIMTLPTQFSFSNIVERNYLGLTSKYMQSIMRLFIKLSLGLLFLQSNYIYQYFDQMNELCIFISEP